MKDLRLCKSGTERSPGQVLAGLPPGEAGDGARVSQVDEGEVDLGSGAQVERREEFSDVRLPFTGAVPHLHQTVVLQQHTPSITLHTSHDRKNLFF